MYTFTDNLFYVINNNKKHETTTKTHISSVCLTSLSLIRVPNYILYEYVISLFIECGSTINKK